MRVPSVLGMGVAAGATAALGVRLAGARTGLVAGLLLAGWPLVSYYAQEGRSFALVTGAVLLGTWCLVQALTTGRRPWWFAYTGSMVVAALLHEFAVLAVVAHGVTLLLVRPGWRVWRALASPRWSARLCRAARLHVAGAGRPGQLHDLADVGHPRRPRGEVPLDQPLALARAGGPRPGRYRRGRPRRATPRGVGLAVVALPLLLVPVGLLLGASLVHPLFQVRYILFSVVGLPLLAARGVEALAGAAGRASGRAVVGWVVAAALVLGVSAAKLPALRHERTRTPARRTSPARPPWSGPGPGPGTAWSSSR